MPRLRYWIAMYLVMTAAVPSGIYLGRRLLLSHETAVIPTATAMPPRYRPDNK
jgi:hypothetical protein